MTMKKIIAILLVIFAITAMFAGCTKGGNSSVQSSAPESSKPESSKTDDVSEPDDTLGGPVYTGSTEPITFSLLMGSWATWDEPMTADPVGRWLIEKTGVTIEAELITGEAADKFALLLATKNYPDFTVWPGDDFGSKFIADGAFVAFDEYLDKLPNVVSRYGDDIGAIYDIETKHIYHITQWSMGNSDDLQQGMIFRSDFLREYFGDDTVTTPKWITISELEKAMLDWKEKNPTNADGKTTYPLTNGTWLDGFVRYFAQAYGIVLFYDVDAEHAGYYYSHENMVEALVTLNRWYNNGILDPEFAINKNENMQSKLSSKVSIGTITHQADMEPVNQVLESEDPDMFMFSHPKVKADEYDAVYEKYSGVGIDGLSLTTACKDIDRAIEWVNFMNDAEVDFYCCNGLPGDDGIWKYDENGMVVLNQDNINAYDDMWDRFRAFGGYKYVWMLSEGKDTRFPAYPDEFYKPMEGIVGEGFNKETLGRSTFWDWDNDKLVSRALFEGISPSSDTEAGIVKTEIDDIWKYALPEIIMAKDEEAARARYQDMLDEMYEAGYQQWLDAVSEKYFVKKAIMGM